MKAVNSCIQFTPTLDGKALFTVEDLQQKAARCIRCSRRWSNAMVRNAASARPAFAMSLWGMYLKQDGQARRAAARSTIACPATCAAAPATGPSSTPPAA
jgi:xanthine dehydrogenase small subunit